ncbi:hypothetical protein HPP92_006594 [Vanilla planifolia]|uniref:DUF668 family protein n=1 Tax=Vanilla planifolia TaxID=51239 RepID=A0A835V793_VANPL|nr:hypothetical protein HPP92_006858 [Vanilla planifolia]KAG0489731.1 hypothetical protein HPP92_006594 [Vanilla planifolia]
MGGHCSKRSTVDRSPSEGILAANCLRGQIPGQSREKFQCKTITSSMERNEDKWFSQPSLPSTDQLLCSHGQNAHCAMDLKEPQISRSLSQNSRSTRSIATAKAGTAKVSEVSSILGRVSTVGFGKAVEVLDNLGSSMTSLNHGSGFVSGSANKGNEISILAFEVANTIVKGANLMQSLSKENIKHLKEVVLPSEGVQFLVSRDIDELQQIAASDKREELKVFTREVVRFGNRCKDPQWHNLDRYFENFGSERIFHPLSKQDVEAAMLQLMTMVSYTADLYHELHSLDRLDQDYRRKLQEENLNAAQRGVDLQILRQELKSQRKHVKSLKKKSIWSRILEEVMEKLVDVVHFLHVEIHNAFGSADGDHRLVRASTHNHRRLGPAGLSLHYANIISQIDTLVCRSPSILSSTRDTLYQGLPPKIRNALRMKLHSFHVKEEVAISEIKAEMDRTLRWLVPIANNTTKAHHGFGWVGEWANTGTEINRKPGQANLIKIETLYHADKAKAEAYILDLVVWLHHLIRLSKLANGGQRSPIKSPISSPTNASTIEVPENKAGNSCLLSPEDQEMLRYVNFRKLIPGISKSQEFGTNRFKLGKHDRLSKSNSQSPTTASKKDFIPLRRPSMLPCIDFNIDRLKALDVIDRVDTLRNL